MSEFTLLLGLYALAGTGISVAVMRKNRTQSDFFVGGGAIHWVISALTYAATTYSAFMMVGLVGLSYASGVGALIFELVYLVATVILLAVYGRRIWTMARENNLVSPMELFALRYGNATAAVGTVVAALALIPYTAVQVIGLAVTLEGYGVSFQVGVAFAVFIIGLWALLGGLRGVAITDALQGVFMLGVAVAALFWTRNAYTGFELSTFPNAVWTPLFFVNLTLPWSFFALTNPQVVQRLFIIKRREDITKMIILFAGFGLLYTLIVTFIGFGAKAGTVAGLFPEVANRNAVIVELMARMAKLLALPLALSIVFASVSTANSILLTLSSMVTRDVLRKKDRTGGMRWILLGLTALVGVFALYRSTHLVELSVSSSRILMGFLPLLFGLFHLKDGGPKAGMLPLIGALIAAPLFDKVASHWSSLLTLAVASGLFVVGMVLDRGTEMRTAV